MGADYASLCNLSNLIRCEMIASDEAIQKLCIIHLVERLSGGPHDLFHALPDFVDRREHKCQQVIVPDALEKRAIWNPAMRWTAVPQFI